MEKVLGDGKWMGHLSFWLSPPSSPFWHQAPGLLLQFSLSVGCNSLCQHPMQVSLQRFSNVFLSCVFLTCLAAWLLFKNLLVWKDKSFTYSPILRILAWNLFRREESLPRLPVICCLSE
ncbi:hypothetical protein BDZ45DRAFT_511488 [Acephala macrosclerotiorum]|nr:hypothetical protein BDZ45DRAFT_511488 [Acephala macrosclerotiorum]